MMKGKSLIGVILAAICVTVTYLLPGSEELSHEGITALGVLGMASILWISNTLPFGVTGRYNWLTDSVFQPYAGLKLGASYAELSSYYYVIKQYTDTWGFFVSPEIGVSIFPRPDYRLGFHVALYYSYATNSGDVLTYSINNINNFGIRVGISF